MFESEADVLASCHSVSIVISITDRFWHQLHALAQESTSLIKLGALKTQHPTCFKPQNHLTYFLFTRWVKNS